METQKINLEQFKKNTWTDDELKNANVVVDFVQNIMIDHDFDYIKEHYGDHEYKQHNQSMTDGLGGVLKTVSDFTKTFPDFTYDVKHLYVDGPYVIVHSHATAQKSHRGNPRKGLNIMDIWRVEDGEIKEHWDAVQPIHGTMRLYSLLNGGKFKNDNTYF